MTVVLVLGILIGAIMGLTGAGGGILAVPVLVGTLGWTMSCGSAKLLSDIISGTTPQIEYDDLNVFRYDAVNN